MKIFFLEAAERELRETRQWYEDQSRGLGDHFLTEVQGARKRIEDWPAAWSSLGGGVRRCRLNRFPYGLIYIVEGDGILIIAVAHHHRQPDYWKDRLSEGLNDGD